MLALFAPCFFFSCGRAADEEKSIEVIPIGEAYRSPSSFLNASDCFTKIRYVPLETSDSALVGDRPVVWIVGDRLIISSDHGCLAFDKNSGRFLNSIGHIGNDPEGSLTLSGWPNAAAGHVYFSAGNGRSVIYDVAGHFVGDYRDQEVTDGLFGVDTYDYLNDSTTVVHLPATLDKPDRILLYRGDSLLASYPSHGEPVSPLSGNMADILKMEMFQQEETGRDIIYLSFRDSRKNALLPSEQIFWHVGDKLFFRETFNDTIYQVGTTGLTPVRRLDFGEMRWDRKDRYDPEKDGAIYPMDVYESERVLWLRFVVNLFDQSEWEVYNALYNKESGEVKVASFGEGLRDDLNAFIPLQPSFSSPSGEFAQIIQSYELLEWFDEHPWRDDWPEEIKALKRLTEEDNPVVILME